MSSGLETDDKPHVHPNQNSEEDDRADTAIGYVRANIRALRATNGMTQAYVAQVARLDLSYIQKLERGRQNPTVRTLARIAWALGVPVHSLLHAPADPGVTRKKQPFHRRGNNGQVPSRQR